VLGSEEPALWKRRKLDAYDEEMLGEGDIINNGYGLFSRIDKLIFSDQALSSLIKEYKIETKISITDDIKRISDFHCIIFKKEKKYYIVPIK
jgi:hypothetical protein